MVVQLEGSIRAFHQIRKQCIATGGQVANGLMPEVGQPSDVCAPDALTFDQLTGGWNHYEWDL
jgi:hypothetical protein